MGTVFDTFSQIFNDGLLPNMKLMIDFLLTGDGMALGFVVILLPLLGKLIRFFKHIF
ncbi:MAG TPA: hypothetical protein IAA51_06755 [Candidatus Cottocaccamicrobium excrementipullorum]|nr:hypothetical protein [Candidatus Cottocaccamicrobium excrementipullorum]